jgi:hypothetical protein
MFFSCYDAFPNSVVELLRAKCSAVSTLQRYHFCTALTVLVIILTHYCAGDKIEMNEMGGACSAYGEGEAFTGFWWGNLKGRDHWGYPGIDGMIILRWIFRKLDVGVWTGLDWLG